MMRVAKTVLLIIAVAAAQVELEMADKTAEDMCSKYSAWGQDAMKGCETRCKKYFPTQHGVDKCMGCGATCFKKVCQGTTPADCVKDPAFMSCDQECLKRDNDANWTCSAYAKWGPKSLEGCKSCATYFPTTHGIHKCMKCGRMCFGRMCEGQSHDECVASEGFRSCDKACLDHHHSEDREKPDVANPICQKYKKYGQIWVDGCESCSKWFPTEEGIDKCLGCGKKCWKKTCQGQDKDACIHSASFMACDKKCLAEQEPPKTAKTSEDCYFDTECHKLVDWEKVGKIKKGFFARLKIFKRLRKGPQVKVMMRKVHAMFVKAGMPDDRVDYILTKWVLYEFPEALSPSQPKTAAVESIMI